MRDHRGGPGRRIGTGAGGLLLVAFSVAFVAACSSHAPPAGRPAAVPDPTDSFAVPDIESTMTVPPYTLTTESPRSTQPPNKPAPKAVPAPAPGYKGPAATNPAQAVANAASVGPARGVRAAVAVLDRRTGRFYGAGDVDYAFASASVVKAFIATRLLVEGHANDPGVKDQMYQMIVASDDNAATALYPLVGREALVPWIASRYHLTGLAPANVPNYWGLTRITARAMVNFYAAIATDSVVGPWLMDAMAHARATAADGFPQLFGLPAVAKSWRVKQGWMCCLESVTRMHSTGFLDGDRYTAALLTEGPTSNYGSYGAQTLTLMAQALLPGGSLPPPPSDPPPATTPPRTTPPATPTPPTPASPTASPTAASATTTPPRTPTAIPTTTTPGVARTARPSPSPTGSSRPAL